MEIRTQSPNLLNILTNFNKVGSRINRISSGDKASIDAVLDLIVDSAIQVVPDTSAVIYTFNKEAYCFDPHSRVAAGEREMPLVGDTPRADGLGMMSIREGRRILSTDADSPPIHPINAGAGAKVVACFPLTVANEHVGALYIFNHKNNPFSQLELLLLENFVFQAAMAIYHARQMTRIQNDLQRREEEARRLQRAGLLISSHSNLDETLETILQMALEVTEAEYGNCMLVSPNGEELVMRATAGKNLSRPNTSNIPIRSKSVTGWVARNRQPVIIQDLKDQPWADNYVIFDEDLEMRSELAVPLIGASGRLEGVINLESPQPHAFNERDSYLLQGLATQAVITIQDMLLLDEIKGITYQLLTRPYQAVLQELANLVVQILRADASVVWMKDERELILQAANYDQQHSERIPLHNSLAGEAILNRSPIFAENLQADPRFHRPDLASRYGWRKALIVPLFVNREQAPVGALSVYSKSGKISGRFFESDWDMKVFTILADYAALAVAEAYHKEALDLVKAQHTAAETFAALGDISANLMHQLNNKVGTIPVRVQGIVEKCAPALEADAYLTDNLLLIEKDAREAMQQVRENLSLLKPLELVCVNLEECLDEALASVSLPPQIKVNVQGFRQLPEVNAGKHSLVFIFSNLLENAAAAMAGEGVIEIKGRANERWVKIDVTDSGSGIEPNSLGKIFEYNFSDGAAKPGHKLGFGLWWIKTLLVRLGGAIFADSDGEGTTFKIRLPHAAHENLESQV